MKTFSAYVNTWLIRLYKTLAVLLVLFAVLLTSARVFLPYADSFKTDLEDYINQEYKGDLSIGELSAGWYKFGPTLVINEVVLSDSEALSIDIDQIEFGVDFWGTIKAGQLKSNQSMFVGVQINIDTTHDLATKPEGGNEANIADVDAIYDLFLNQIQRFSMLDSNVHIKTASKERTIVIKKLAWLNEKDSHKGIGELQLEGMSTNSAKLIIDLHGDARENIEGQIYLEGNNLNFASWFDRYLGEQADQISSKFNFQTWINIRQGEHREIHFSLGENILAWDSFEEQDQLTIPSGNISIYRHGTSGNYSIQSSEIDILFNDHPWQTLQFQSAITELETVTNISSISLDKLWQLRPILADNFDQLKEFSEFDLRGTINQLQLRKSVNNFQIKAKLDDLSWQYSNFIPGVENLSADLLFSQNQLQLNVGAHDTALDFADSFSRPIPINHIAAGINLSWGEQYWRLAVNDISLRSDEISLNGDVQYEQQQDQSGVLSLFTFIDKGDASKAQYYLPLDIMEQDLVDYLMAAIYSGDVQQATVLLHGPLENFPFVDNSGVFIVDADIKQAKYQFVDTWPAIDKAHLNLNFTNDSMFISVYDGDLLGTQTKDVTVAIDSLGGDSILTVRAPLTSQVEALTKLMVNSPLASTIGETLTFIGPKGEVTGVFALDLPLADTDLAVAKGTVEFSDNQAFLDAPEMEFEQIRGQLSFNNELITTKDLTLNWRGLPIALDVNGRTENDYYQVDINLIGQWQKATYGQQIPKKLQKYLNGQLDWQGKLSLFVPEEGDFSYRFNLHSDLQKVELSLPFPFAKSVGSSAALSAKVSGGPENSIIEATLNDNLRFYGDLDHNKTSFARSQLVLGTEKMVLPMNGFHITTALGHIEYKPWHELIFDIINSIPSEDKPLTTQTTLSNEGIEEPETPALLEVPERIRGTVKTVDLFGQTLHDVDFNLLHKEQFWLLQVNAEEIRSRLKFYHEFAEKGLEVDADYIHIDVTDIADESVVNNDELAKEQVIADADTELESGDEITISPNDIPKIAFSCDSCKFQNLNFGKLTFKVDNSDPTLVTVKGFSAKRKGTEMKLSGAWQQDGLLNETQFIGTFETSELEKEVKAFGFESGIKDSGLKSSFDISWQGAPQAFNFETLNGKVKARLSDGYLADVSDKGARLLSIFSFQSLVRKLSLDFRDIFGKGMFYEDFKGDFKIHDGVVYTGNLKMNGAAGNLTVKGNTNLVTNQLDYKMSFVPKVTSSIPIIVSWMVNPVVGLAALAVDEVIQKAEVISVINFELTGTIDKPSFKEVDRKSKDINVGKSKPDKVTEPKAPPQSKGAGNG